jgi:imidazole glycerol phosphate synthase subunit HisF
MGVSRYILKAEIKGYNFASCPKQRYSDGDENECDQDWLIGADRASFSSKLKAANSFANAESLFGTRSIVVALDLSFQNISRNPHGTSRRTELGPKYWTASHFDVDATTFQCFGYISR